MQQEAQRVRAHGIVAMRIEQKSHMWGSHVIEFLAIGTSVKLVAAEHRRIAPELSVSLDDEVIPVTDAAAAAGGGSEG
jgi:hypothetical protein